MGYTTHVKYLIFKTHFQLSFQLPKLPKNDAKFREIVIFKN